MSTRLAANDRHASISSEQKLPGSTGEHRLQGQHGTERRAHAFYRNQMLDRLNDRMQAFVRESEMVFVSTADGQGHCDCSIRTGPSGFVCVVDDKTLAYPEYRGNGVMASLGNLSENAHIGLLFVDFFGSTVGCHVNGRAQIVENTALLDPAGVWPAGLRTAVQSAFDPVETGRHPERWVVIRVEEAYIHCSKHIPRFARLDKSIPWGTDDPAAKGGDFFQVKDLPRPWREAGTAAS